MYDIIKITNAQSEGDLKMTANFLFVSDDKYVKNLGICTCSVIENMCDVVEKLRLFVMDCGINGENKARLQKQALKYDNVELVFYNINEKLHEVAPRVKTKWHPAIYGRLFLVDVLDQYDDIDRQLRREIRMVKNGEPVLSM